MTTPLRIAVVHYHLRPGGVTRVIERTAHALSDHNIRTTVLVGEVPPDSEIALPGVQCVEDLAYSTGRGPDGEELFARILDAAAEGLGAPPDLWHIHNHNLGKNASLPRAVEAMARKGQRLLLHFHDLPEDSRPANYRFLLDNVAGGDSAALGSRLYPVADHVHYAVLNHRDLSFLRKSGVPEQQLHYLPNPVCLDIDHSLPENRPDQNLYIYPTRAIRRKNIGEFLLWSALAQDHERFAITLSPRNPLFRPVYERWVELGASLHLPVEFDLAARTHLSFPQLLSSAGALVTTSVAEGFGLAFLEPWLATRPLLGRNLAEITAGFEHAGIDLSGMYTFLRVPLDWIGSDRLRTRISSELEKFLQSYGRTPAHDHVDRAVASMTSGKFVDFGRLDEQFQEHIIRRIVESPECRNDISQTLTNPEKDLQARIVKNRNIITRDFGPDSYADRLVSAYTDIMNSSASEVGGISQDVLLDEFLAPERFNLLRTT
jgi:glycosyltransferase involved in cell wall biosynthesis